MAATLGDVAPTFGDVGPREVPGELTVRSRETDRRRERAERMSSPPDECVDEFVDEFVAGQTEAISPMWGSVSVSMAGSVAAPEERVVQDCGRLCGCERGLKAVKVRTPCARNVSLRNPQCESPKPTRHLLCRCYATRRYARRPLRGRYTPAIPGSASIFSAEGLAVRKAIVWRGRVVGAHVGALVEALEEDDAVGTKEVGTKEVGTKEAAT